MYIFMSVCAIMRDDLAAAEKSMENLNTLYKEICEMELNSENKLLSSMCCGDVWILMCGSECQLWDLTSQGTNRPTRM